MNLQERLKDFTEIPKGVVISRIRDDVGDSLKCIQPECNGDVSPYYYPDYEGKFTQALFTPRISLHNGEIRRIFSLDEECEFDGISFRITDDNRVEILIVKGKKVINTLQITENIPFEDLLYIKRLSGQIKSFSRKSGKTLNRV